MRYTDKQMKDGRARLKRLLPEARTYAREAIRNPDIQMQVNSAKGMATQQFIRVNNFRALVVYRTPRGWYADLLLKEVPAGVSDVMGTPLSMPHKTREEAEEGAAYILKSMCVQSIMNEGAVSDQPQNDERPFNLYNIVVPLPGQAIDLCVPVIAMTGQTVEEARGYAVERLKETCERLKINEETTVEDMAKLSDDDHQEIFRLCCMMAAANCGEYPLSKWAAEEVMDDSEPAQTGKGERSSDTASTTPS